MTHVLTGIVRTFALRSRVIARAASVPMGKTLLIDNSPFAMLLLSPHWLSRWFANVETAVFAKMTRVASVNRIIMALSVKIRPKRLIPIRQPRQLLWSLWCSLSWLSCYLLHSTYGLEKAKRKSFNILKFRWRQIFNNFINDSVLYPNFQIFEALFKVLLIYQLKSQLSYYSPWNFFILFIF